MSSAEQLFDEHHQALYRYLVRFCGDADTAADAAQEAFVRLIERPPAPGTERTWLFTVATNIAMDMGRAQTRRAMILRKSPDRAPLGDAPRDPHELVESAEERRVVADALRALSPKERTALLMREEGFTHREIAQAIGTTTGTIGTLVARALDRLSKQLDLDIRGT